MVTRSKMMEIDQNIDILNQCIQQNYDILRKDVEGVAREAARLRYEEPDQYREYLHAKKEAAKRLGVKSFPSNRWVYKFYHEIADIYEGKENREAQLFEMRHEALEWMKILKDFKPRVIGSVERGDVTKKSDIDLHVFVDEYEEEVCEALEALDIDFEYGVDTARCGDERVDYHHIYVKDKYECEISVYVKGDYKQQTCSIFGIPVKGLTIKQLQRIINEQTGRKRVAE
jgi:predicted nucleotidyltransferase